MATPRQVRFHYGRCRKRFYHLLCALNEAHMAGVINYKPKKSESGYPVDTLESVCDAVYDAKEKFDIATFDQLAYAMKVEIMKELKDVY